MNINDKVRAEITSINDDGIKLKYDCYEGRLRIIDLEWNLSGILERMYANYKVGDFIDVVVINVAGDKFLGSQKDLFPDLNPWRNTGVYKVGCEFNSVVKKIVDFGCFVELSTGAIALIKKKIYIMKLIWKISCV